MSDTPTPRTDKAWSDPSSGKLMDTDWGGNVIHQAKVSRDLEQELLEMVKFRDLLANKEIELLKQLTAHKAALNLCQMALNADIHDTFLELKFEALAAIKQLKEEK